jgi:hypothetical protein
VLKLNLYPSKKKRVKSVGKYFFPDIFGPISFNMRIVIVFSRGFFGFRGFKIRINLSDFIRFSYTIGGAEASKIGCFMGLSGEKYRMCSIVQKYAYFIKMKRIN